MRCPRCGKETNVLVEGVCPDCYIEREKISLKKKVVHLCPRCGRIKVGKDWKSIGSIGEFISSNLKTKINEPKVKVEKVEIGKDRLHVLFVVYGMLGGKHVSKEVDTTIKIIREVCPSCLAPDSFDFKLQFRGDYQKPLDEALGIVDRYKLEKKREGIDLLVRDKKAARDIVKSLRKKFNFEIKESYKLVGEDVHSGRKRYKATFLLRFK